MWPTTWSHGDGADLATGRRRFRSAPQRPDDGGPLTFSVGETPAALLAEAPVAPATVVK